MKDRKFYSGSSLDQALMKAARDLGVPKEALRYRQIEKKHGFLKMRRSIVIEVDPNAQPEVLSDEEASARAQKMEPVVGGRSMDRDVREEPEPTAERPQRRSRPKRNSPPRHDSPPRGGMVEVSRGRSLGEKYPQAQGEVADAIRESLGMLLELADVDMESSVHEGAERYEIELWGPDQEVLLRDNGRPLLSLQHLLVRVVRGLTGESIYCRVDCDQFHEIREERLRDLAQRVASDVAHEGRSRLLESMAPDERRIVHLTLADDPDVDTESQGNGYYKRVKIFPV
jgi:spoIIIJ-associated protein